ncbi:conserved Plasmodium protein, unknown function [Plasmodium ovale curtisi]|uniref:Uncharacterized protein n=1 Tax=Plasmodium ovale curtisi TaxID=864141 RepID=A0A1A8WWY4_PLAOA|nr:conserved Plasmodium protein, unknown function [Plasmodium ovale curtisi]
MNIYRKAKTRCKISCIDIELEAFIFGCFLYTWNKILTDNAQRKKSGNMGNTGRKGSAGKNSFHTRGRKGGPRKGNFTKTRNAKGSINKNANENANENDSENASRTAGTNLQSDLHGKGKRAYVGKGVRETGKCRKEKVSGGKSCGRDENDLSDNDTDDVRCNMNEEFQTKNKINIKELNEKLLHFVKINFCLSNKDFRIFHDLYFFYTHIREEKREEEINIHYNFFNQNSYVSTLNSKIDNSKNIKKITSKNKLKKKVEKGFNKINKNCLFCDISLNKEKISKFKKIQKFLHVCTGKVYGKKNFEIVNKCIVNIRTFDDNFIHSITVERLFSYIYKYNDKNLLFFWFKFLNVLLKVTINKQLMIKIFFFFCINSLLISSYFNSEQVILQSHKFSNKNMSINKNEKNDILSEFIKKYKYENIINIILNSNYILLQNLFDYFYLICTSKNMTFYDHFFVNVQMINFIYLVQINFFHYYYIKLYKKYQREYPNQINKQVNPNDDICKSNEIMRKCNSKGIEKDETRCKLLPISIRENSPIRVNTCDIASKINSRSSAKKLLNKNDTLHVKEKKFNNFEEEKSKLLFHNASVQKWKVRLILKEKVGGTVSSTCLLQDIHGCTANNESNVCDETKLYKNEDNTVGKNYNVGGKRCNKLNLQLQRYLNGSCNFSKISNYVSRKMRDKPTEEKRKNSYVLQNKFAFEREKRLKRNLTIFFKRTYTFLNKYIKSEELKNQSNIFSFLFDALPSSNLTKNVSNSLEPHIFTIFSQYEFIKIYNFIESLKGLYNLKNEKKKSLRNNEQANLKYLNNLQGLNYIYNNLKNDYMLLVQNLYFEIKEEKFKTINIWENNKFKYNKNRINNLIRNERTDIYKNVCIYKLSSKQLNIQHNLFNVYLECNLLNKAYKLVMIDFDFSFSLTSEIIFLYKIYLIELKKNNILLSFDTLNMAFHKCFVLLKKYVCNPTAFKLLSVISIHFSHMIYNFPFLSKYLCFLPSEKIEFIEKNILMNENVTWNCCNDYFFQKNHFTSFDVCNSGVEKSGGGRCVLRGDMAHHGTHHSASFRKQGRTNSDGGSGVSNHVLRSRASCTFGREHTFSANYHLEHFSAHHLQLAQNDKGGVEKAREVGSNAVVFSREGHKNEKVFFCKIHSQNIYENAPCDQGFRRSSRDNSSNEGESESVKEGGNDCRNEGCNDGRNEGGNDGRNECGNDGRNEGSSDGRNEGGSDGRNEGGSDGRNWGNWGGCTYETKETPRDTCAHCENAGEYNFWGRNYNLYISKILKSFNFIFNILEKTVSSNDVSVIYCSKNVNTMKESPLKKKQPLSHGDYEENMCSVTKFIKEVVNKLENYFNKNFKRKNLQNHVKDLDEKKFRNFLYNSKVMRRIRYTSENSFFCCLEFLFLAYICSNYFSDNNITNRYNNFFKTFNFNDIWPSNHQIMVKILLSLVYMLLYEINSMDLREFFMHILKIILCKFYDNLDYNDLQIFQYIFLNISNDTLFCFYSLTDDIKNIININQSTLKEFFYIYNLSKRREVLCQYDNAWDRAKKKNDFVRNFFHYFLQKSGEVAENSISLLGEMELMGDTLPGSPLPGGKIYHETNLYDTLTSERHCDLTCELFQKEPSVIFNETCRSGLIWEYNPGCNQFDLRQWMCENETDAHAEGRDYVSPNLKFYTFDYFSSESSLENNDFVFFEKTESMKNSESLGSNFLDKILIHVNKKNGRKKKEEMERGTCEENYKWCTRSSLLERGEMVRKEFSIGGNNPFEKIEFSHFSENKMEHNYELIFNYFKMSKEIYIDDYIKGKKESLINIQQQRNRMNYYQNVKPDYYKAYNFEKSYYLTEEIFETNCFIFAQNKNMVRNNFTLEKNNYVHVCLNLLTIIDLYMEFKVNMYNKPFYFIKNLIITCANISFSNHLTILYINALVRLCLFEIRMNNLFISSNILVEILSNFEKIKIYKKLIGIIFYLCGYILFLHLSWDYENRREENNKSVLIKEYNYYAKYKKNYLCRTKRGKLSKDKDSQKNKMFITPEICEQTNGVIDSDKGGNYSHETHSAQEEEQNIYTHDTPYPSKDTYKKDENLCIEKKDNAIFAQNSGSFLRISVGKDDTASGDDANKEKKKKNSAKVICEKGKYEKRKCDQSESAVHKFAANKGAANKSSTDKNAQSKSSMNKGSKKLIPLVKNQIKITDYFSNIKNDKFVNKSADKMADNSVGESMSKSPCTNSAASDTSLYLNSSYRKCLKKRKINDELTSQVILHKGKFNSEENVGGNKNSLHALFDRINKKQFFLFLICFYFKKALHYWKKDGDNIGISNGIQQRNRIKDIFFFLMCSYKFFYKSSLFLSKHVNIQNYKFPLFNYELFKTYHKFYTYYKGIFLKCSNENVVRVLW